MCTLSVEELLGSQSLAVSKHQVILNRESTGSQYLAFSFHQGQICWKALCFDLWDCLLAVRLLPLDCPCQCDALLLSCSAFSVAPVHLQGLSSIQANAQVPCGAAAGPLCCLSASLLLHIASMKIDAKIWR